MVAANVSAGRFDRLSSTLFVAVLAHGIVILGVTFAPSAPPAPAELPSINVTLLVDTATAETAPPDTDLLSSRDQAGASEGDSQRPTRTLTAEHPRNQEGELLGADAVSTETLEAGPAPDQLVTRADAERDVEAVPETTEQSAPKPQTAAALMQQQAPDTLAAEVDDEAASTDSDDGTVAAPSTRQAALSTYMVGWRQRVERIGTANFPLEFLSSQSGATRPVVEVTIDANGTLHEVVLRRSSGNNRLDDAALRILELAAPFEALPEAILAEAEMLRFAYEWDFSTAPR